MDTTPTVSREIPPDVMDRTENKSWLVELHSGTQKAYVLDSLRHTFIWEKDSACRFRNRSLAEDEAAWWQNEIDRGFCLLFGKVEIIIDEVEVLAQ